MVLIMIASSGRILFFEDSKYNQTEGLQSDFQSVPYNLHFYQNLISIHQHQDQFPITDIITHKSSLAQWP